MLGHKQIEESSDLCCNCAETTTKEQGIRHRVWMFCKPNLIAKSLMDRHHTELPKKWREARKCPLFKRMDDEYCDTTEPCMICPKNPEVKTIYSSVTPCKECAKFEIKPVNTPEHIKLIQDIMNDYLERIGK